MTKPQDFSGSGSDLGRGLQTSPAQPSLLHRSHLSSTEQSPFPSATKPQSEATRTWTSSSPSTVCGWKQVLWPLDYWGGKKKKKKKNSLANTATSSGLQCLIVEGCERVRPSIYLKQPGAKAWKGDFFFKKHTLLWFLVICFYWSWGIFAIDHSGSKGRTRLCMYQADTTQVLPPRASQKPWFQ